MPENAQSSLNYHPSVRRGLLRPDRPREPSRELLHVAVQCTHPQRWGKGGTSYVLTLGVGKVQWRALGNSYLRG